jgi:hypothetical protein
LKEKAYPWDKDIISVGDIRKLGNLASDAQVVEENLRDGTERVLAEYHVLRPGKLEDGKRPTKRVNFRPSWRPAPPQSYWSKPTAQQLLDPRHCRQPPTRVLDELLTPAHHTVEQ